MNKLNKIKSLVLRDPRYFIAFGFGSGLTPFAPGTFGTLASILVYFLLVNFTWHLYIGFVSFAFVVGVIICNEIAKELGINDYQGIVWDEFIGFWLTMFLVPFELTWLILGFVLFRAFDILKPFPIKRIEMLKHKGFAIMFDDVIAALYAWLTLHLIILVCSYGH
ncbi:MAG: phosphatidylglycerophosphatase [Legionellales bacterium RIFCSPHIGHO2_12_FULL_37_14]|nr:MAG: phosphatidylglycerophosphatase [Legionellales bacterium RIFCSPHIGHO2_12_FULL_37_14]